MRCIRRNGVTLYEGGKRGAGQPRGFTNAGAGSSIRAQMLFRLLSLRHSALALY